MTVGWYAPAVGARSGVADYAGGLEAELARRFTIRRDADGDVNVYQTGNNQMHREIYARAIARPGIVVLHDAVLQHFFLGSLNREAYVAEFVYNYGEWQRGLAEALWARRSRSGADEEYFRYPMLRRLAETARAVIVHNPAAAAIVRRHSPEARVVEIPHYFAMPELPSAQDVLAWRASRGVRWDTCLFAVMGYLRESKRINAVDQAVWAIPDSALLLQGDPVAGMAPLPAEGVIRVGYVDERDFWTIASAVDVCVNLRWPAAGETSGIMIRMMGLGKPCMVTAGDEVSRLPEASCFRVDPGAAEREMLAMGMRWLADSATRRREMGRIAAGHIREHHSLAVVAEAYSRAIREASR